MGLIEPYLPDIWLFIIGFFLLYYAVADGYGLGVGILSLFARDEEERSIMMESIESTWHDNQTWLVLLGGMLFGAFPLFYSLVLSSLYIPILLMLFGLIFRGISFEFRSNSDEKRTWSLSFGFGSLIVTIAQGFALGGLLSGLPVKDGVFAGSVWGWLNPFSVLVTAGVLGGYVMLGSNYLILKTHDEIQQRSYRISLLSSIITLVVSVTVHLRIVAMYPHAAGKWTHPPDCYAVWAFVLLAGIAFVLLLVSLEQRREIAPLFCNMGIILFSFVGMSVAMYPYMIPNVIASPLTVHSVAASPDTLWFMLVVVMVLIPLILTYTGYKHRLFRGKTTESGYESERGHG
jgi:cytochrome d ubiquinol oxidase subunit II